MNLENKIKIITQIERRLFSSKDYSKVNSYSNFENYLWILKTNYPFNTYQKLAKISGINAFPNTKLKAWIEVIKNGGKGIKKKMGLFLRLPFQPKQLLPINADFYFDKGNYGIAIYMNKEYSKVVKFVQTTTFSGIQKLEKEVKSLKIANAVNHPKVKTATITNVVKDENLNYFEQDLIFANDLHSLSKKNLNEVYEDVFDFMLMFYIKCGIKTVSLSDKNFEIDEVLQHIETLKNGADILKKVKELKSKNKRLLQTCVHGDLSLNNILIDKNKTIWIIDWGESDEEYLAKDFKNDNFDTSLLYNTIVNQLSLDKNELYSLEDQIFIQDYTEMLRLIYNQIIEKQKDVHFTSKLNAIINRMSITNK